MKSSPSELRNITFVFLLLAATTMAAPAENYSVLYNFGTNSGDPRYGTAPGVIAQGRDGNLYSTSLSGGTGHCGNGNSGCGTIFQVTPAGALNVIYNFTGGSDGAGPNSGLTLGSDGNLYGTTAGLGYGTIFSVTPGGAFTLLHTLSQLEGGLPQAPPIQATDGNFYGTTMTNGKYGFGTVYKITPSGTFTVLHQFTQRIGSYPSAPLVQGADGNLYGTTSGGGTNHFGVIFSLTLAGKYTVLYNFQTFDGPASGALIQVADGNFYGSTIGGGASGAGSLFQITPAGQFTVLYSLNGNTDGSFLYAALVQATDGALYGAAAENGACATCGTLFKLDTAENFTLLHDMQIATGNEPMVSLLAHTNGALYGDTFVGGTGGPGFGVVYSWNAGLAPFVTFLPAQSVGKVGASIGILGQGFTGATGASFGGVPATVSVSSDTFLTATVPNGALTGSIKVVTPGGTLVSNRNFRVTPVIKKFTPTSGPVGTVVTITGVSLTQTAGVSFGGVAATSVKVISDTQLTAKVPAGAATGRITLTTAGGTAKGPGSFTVTP